jgi:EAL domain-containing protein (putative c-di-GMP-specific phosphodiesterase class I)
MELESTKVLLADGDERAARKTSEALRSVGFVVETTGDGADLVARLNGPSEFDVVITELTLVGVHGVELLRALRSVAPALPVLIVTSSPSLDTAIAAVEQCAFRYFPKPVAVETLVEAVRSATALGRFRKLKQRALELCESGQWPLSAREELSDSFERALDRLWVAFQPIVHWPERRVCGYEALVRCSEKALPHPGALFDAAEHLGRTAELGRRIHGLIAERAPDVLRRGTLFVNLHPADLKDETLFSSGSPLAAFAESVVFELTERQSLESVPDLRARVARLRELGYRLAIDDLGAGYAGLSAFSLLEPDIVKLDMSLVRDVDQSPRKRSIVRSMISVCRHELGTSVVCEGVETIAERDALVALGAELLQGYLFGRPTAELCSTAHEELPAVFSETAS